MDKEDKLTSSVQSFDPNPQWRRRKESEEQHLSLSASLVLPNPYLSDQFLRGNQSSMSSKPTGGGNMSKSHGYSSSRRVKETKKDFQLRDRLGTDGKTPKANGDSLAQGRVKGKNFHDAQKRGFRGAESVSSTLGRPKPAHNDSVPFEVKMADFPELAGVPLRKVGPPVTQKECWGPPPGSTSPQRQASMWRFGSQESTTQPEFHQCGTTDMQDSSGALQSQQVVTSWASVASQPPKKPAPEEGISKNNFQTEDIQEAGDPGKRKRRKKKKKTKGAGDDADIESEALNIYQEPPKFEDEEEFPGLTPALSVRLTSSRHPMKLCNEENQREVDQPLSVDPNKEKRPGAKMLPEEAAKKGQKAGKKSKVPVQLDIGNMLAALEKKQQSQKPKHDAKPVILSVGGGLPVVQKQPSIQKKSPWQQDKIAHNPLDSTSPLVKKGKQREVPKAKKPTPLKKVILKEREERKQKRLLEERGIVLEDENKPVDDAAGEEQCDVNTIALDEINSPAEDLDPLEFEATDQMLKEEDEETHEDQETIEQETTAPVLCPASQRKIHSRKFRDYCSQMLSKDIDECVTDLLKELVRFQDRLYQKDPMKARMKRRIVMGLREVLKHLKLRKIKCVVISPNCERIESKGGLDEALHTIIDMCREQGVPFVFALSRKALGRCVNKAVPVSLVGIFNYDGAQDCYHKMIELSSEARTAYEVMVLSPEKEETNSEQAVNTEEKFQIGSLATKTDSSPDYIPAEEPEYIKIWKKMLEKENNHKVLNFEEQLSLLHLDTECTENSQEEKS